MDHQALAQLLGNYGEFFGSIAVLVTLIYLAVQVRYSKKLLHENRNVALSQISQTNAGYRLDLQRYLADPRVLELREKVEGDEAVYSALHKTNFDRLTPAEKKHWRSIQAQFAIIIDDGLYQSTLGLVGDNEREILERSVAQSMPYWAHFDNYVPTRLRHWLESRESN